MSEVVGQELAIHQMTDAICDHLGKEQSNRPLVLSVHGPPGVGKSMSHALLAQAMYGEEDDCPGSRCPGYKVLQGMDHINAEREQQHWYLRKAILDHFHQHAEALLVIEEYDKLDCATRAVLRQFVTAPASANVTMGKAIILLESNIGQSTLHQMLVHAGIRSKVTPEQAHNTLRNLVYSVWNQADCEGHVDIIKLLGAIDFFLPYFPLGGDSIRSLFEKQLEKQADRLLASHAVKLGWDPQVVDFLMSKVDFGECSAKAMGCYPVEGARPVSTIMTRYVSRAIKTWHVQQQELRQQQKVKRKAANPGWQGSIARQAEKVLNKHTVVYAQLTVGEDQWTLIIQ